MPIGWFANSHGLTLPRRIRAARIARTWMSRVGATSAAVLCSCLRNQDMRWVTTSWTQVLAARDAPTESVASGARVSCASAYWYPLYAFVRRQGLDA